MLQFRRDLSPPILEMSKQLYANALA